jgi:polyisoprenoid-binding protein YceI
VTNSTPSSSPSSGTSSDTGLTFTLDQNQSQALYKARETLANIGSPTEAVGKTSQVSGSIAFTTTGAIDSSASKITIDLSTLQSDKSQRDNYIKRNSLNTDQFPDAVFVPTVVQGLSWPLPTSGQATFKLTGNLTVHGQTSPTTWDVTATFGPQQIKGTATTTVKFEDFGMKPPSTMLVLSVEDNLTLELDFVFTHGS